MQEFGTLIKVILSAQDMDVTILKKWQSFKFSWVFAVFFNVVFQKIYVRKVYHK